MDPFHADGFADLDLEGSVVIALGGMAGESAVGAIGNGWMAIDWCENPVGWIADGTPSAATEDQFEFRTGPYGRVCAYPLDVPRWLR